MDYQDLVQWVEAEPFDPFRLVMTDGRKFDIRSPRMIWPGKRSVLIGFPDDPTEADVPGRHITVAMLHVVRVEPLNPPVSAGP